MQTQKRNGHQLNAKAIKQSQKRNRPLNASGIKQTKQTAERKRYKADPEKKWSAKGNVLGRVLNVLACMAKRVRYGKAKRSTVQNQRGHRKSTTDKVIQRYVNVVTFS